MSSKRVVHLCGDEDCPHDPLFEHRFYFGCVPKDFKDRTGRSKTNHQTRVESDAFQFGYCYLWNGGCDARIAASATTPGEPG